MNGRRLIHIHEQLLLQTLRQTDQQTDRQAVKQTIRQTGKKIIQTNRLIGKRTLDLSDIEITDRQIEKRVRQTDT